jgi:hypothetical protein
MTAAVDVAQYGTTSPSWRNRIINGDFTIAQRATSATVAAGTAVPTVSTGYPCVDRWFVYSTGANVTAAQVAGSGTVQNRLQITGAASVTAVGVGQRIETNNSYDLNGKICTLSVDLANSVLTTVTWTASYANTSNTFGTIGTPTKTQIATGTFTVNSTVANYTTQITIPSAAVTGIEILFTVGAQTSGTWTIGNVQFEAGSAASPFEYLSYSTELALCQRYFEKSFNLETAPVQNVGALQGALVTGAYTTSASAILATACFAVEKRVAPTVTTYNPFAAGSGWSRSGAADLAAGIYGAGTRAISIRVDGTPTLNANMSIHWTASAELA